MKRLALASVAAGFGGLAWAQTAPMKIETLIEALRGRGVEIQVVLPFADTEARAHCGYTANATQNIYVLAGGWKFSGPALAKGGMLRDFIAISPQNEVHCYDRVELADLSFEDGALIGAKLTIEDRIPHMDLVSISKVTFGYEWRRMATRVDLELDLREIKTKKSFTLSTALKLGGIDFIALQENKGNQPASPLAFLTASLQSLHLKFYDRGLRDIFLERVARETGSTSRRLQREAYATLEQVRQVLDVTGNQILGDAIGVIQDAIVDGGGGEILIEPSRPVTALEFLAAVQTDNLETILGSINMTSKRLP